MERPLFSEMLVDRRRELGLSIKQASNVLRLKEEVLIAFEEGDFDSIPKSGYAQGMLSSYARYLGLNAKTIVNQFSTDLFEYERGTGSQEPRRRSRRGREGDDGPLYEKPPMAAYGQGRRGAYVDSHGFLPTSGGYAGDLADFATTSDPRPRYASASDDERDNDPFGNPYPQGRPYTSRVPLSGSVTPLGQAQRQRPVTYQGSYGQQDQYGRVSRASSSRLVRDEVTTRRVMPSQYRDDLRLDNNGGSYQAASSGAGRRSSRNIANTQRPNVRRRSNSRSRADVRGRDRAANGGIAEMLSSLFEDRARMVALIVIVLAIILTVMIIVSVRSCVGAQQSTGRSVAVTSTEEQKEPEESTKVSDEEEARAREEAAAAKAAEADAAVSERTIEVTVADGEVTWLEISYDGNSDVAETVTGPWNRTYTVRQSISINVNKTSAVTVTEGGKKLEFDSKASGIGTITVQVSKKVDDETEKKEEGAAGEEGQAGATDGETATSTPQEGTAQTQTQVTDQQQTTQGQTQTQTQYQQGTSGGATNNFEGYTLDSDGYYYGADGYYDANGTFYSY